MERLKKGFKYVEQREVVQCPNDKTHGMCLAFSSQKGDIWHKCERCIDERETVKGQPNKFYGQGGVMIGADGRCSGVKVSGVVMLAAKRKKTDGDDAAAAPPSASGTQLVEFQTFVRTALEDLQRKQDLVYQWMLAHPSAYPHPLPTNPGQELPDA